MDDLLGGLAPAERTQAKKPTRPAAPATAASDDWLSFDAPLATHAAKGSQMTITNNKLTGVNLMQSGPLTLPRKISPSKHTRADKDLLASPNLLRQQKVALEGKPSAEQQTRSSRAAWHKHQGEGALTMRQRLSKQKVTTPQKASSALSKEETPDEDSFGDFVEAAPEMLAADLNLLDMGEESIGNIPEAQPSPIKQMVQQPRPDLLSFDTCSSAPDPITSVDSLDAAEDDDDFGDFVESPNPGMGTFDQPEIEASRPSTTEMLQFLLDHVLIVPEGFFKALGPLSYPLRQKVLHNERTKAWVRAMSDAGALCQRLIKGRHHATRSLQEEGSETTLVRQVMARWTTLLPRLKSLSAGQHVDLRPLEDNQLNNSDHATTQCSICLTGMSNSERHAACCGLQKQMALAQVS